MLRWLHISDLHVGRSESRDPYEVDSVLGPLVKTVEAAVSRDEGPDMLFVTGDIARSGSRAEYNSCAPFFTRLMEAANLDESRVWIVPGNHDVNREHGKYLVRTLASEDESIDFFGKADARAQHMRKFSEYRNFINKLLPGRKFAAGDVVHEPTVLEIHGVRVGLLPVNTCMFSQNDDDNGRLWIGTRTVRQRLEMLQQLDPDITIALMHHPHFYLHEDESAASWLQNGVDLVLRGHLHRSAGEQRASYDGIALELAAGAIYQNSKSKPCRMLACSLEERSIVVEPLTYLDSPQADTWVLDVAPFAAESDHKGRFEITPNAQIRQAGDQSHFPFDNWASCTSSEWLPTVVEWFSERYPQEPNRAMGLLLDHVFDILRMSELTGQSNLCRHVSSLGRALRPFMQSRELECPHHAWIVELVGLGLERQLSHLFMLPRVRRDEMLDIPDYSRLLLSTRYLAMGEYKRAHALARELSGGCSIAGYVVGQSLRKRGFVIEAHQKLGDALAILDSFDDHVCAFTVDGDRCCDRRLLSAEVNRGIGVVLRVAGDSSAVEYFSVASKTAEEIALADSDPKMTPISEDEASTAPAAFDATPSRVAADVLFSFGYYWYEKEDTEQAAILFRKAIDALERVDESWDSPYTRLGIIRLSQHGRESEAAELLLRGRAACVDTPVWVNREAPLSQALCSLALHVLQTRTGQRLLEDDPIHELESALSVEPRLAAGPLECHMDDACRVRSAATEPAVPIVDSFIALLQDELATIG